MKPDELKIGVCFCGSFCTLRNVINEIKAIKELGIDIYPIMSNSAQSMDTRFGKAEDFMKEIEKITEKEIIKSINEAEPIGPKNYIDVMVIAPCTGNTLAKLNTGITDS